MVKSRAGKAVRALPGAEAAYVKVQPADANDRVEERKKAVALEYEREGCACREPPDPVAVCRRLVERFKTVAPSNTIVFEGGCAAVHAREAAGGA